MWPHFSTCPLLSLLLSQFPCTNLVCSQGHADFIADAEQQQSALRAADSDLADELVKDLRIQLAAHRADARFAGLALLQLGVQLLLQIDHVQAGRGAKTRFRQKVRIKFF